MIKPDLQALDDKVWRNRNVKAELAYCGTYMKHRKSITNLDLRFYAWLFRAALKRIEELEGEDAKGKEEKQKIKIFFKDGKTDVIPQKFWGDYEVNDNLFVVKKKGAWIAFYSMDIIACMVVG